MTEVVKSDGSGARQLATPYFSSIDWSPDGRSLVGTDGQAIYIIDAASGNVRTVPSGASYGDGFNDPVWSHDGRQIAYFAVPGQSDPQVFGLSIMNADGSNPHRVSSAPSLGKSLAWSPDDSHLAVVPDDNDAGLVIMATDGSDVKHVGFVNADGSKTTIGDLPILLGWL